MKSSLARIGSVAVLAGLALGACSTHEDRLGDIEGSLAPLRSWFEAHADQPRALLLLSPL